jgi:hypothetical protein
MAEYLGDARPPLNWSAPVIRPNERKQNEGDVNGDLHVFLSKAGFDDYTEALVELGVREVEELDDELLVCLRSIYPINLFAQPLFIETTSKQHNARSASPNR